MRDLKRAGATRRTLEKAGIPLTWLVTEWTENAFGRGQASAGYTAFAPIWAVEVSSCTLLDATERIVILEHCLQHPAAMRAVNSAFRLGGLPARRAPAGKNKTSTSKAADEKARAALRQFFAGVLFTTGP